ncbi:MAG TPA: protease pro-enzyme activation domain-containing protein, partial [Candidatus Limnocylindria bacterium]|nr:protease pro-enzyme activation domain-containing protein [Candidatus Limnocylindria bacterium]
MKLTRVLVIAAVLVSACSQPAPQPTENAVPSALASPAAVKEAKPSKIGPTAENEPIQFSVSLRLPGAADLDRYLHGLVTPGSSNYQHFLTPDEFGTRFGLADSAIAPI